MNLSNNTKPELRLDWCSYKAAKYACEHWHYSGCVPAGKLVKIGVWEDGKFIGVVLFGRGATPQLCKPYGLSQIQCVELVRVALTNHSAPVSRILAIAIRMVKNFCDGLRLIISFADPKQSHHGGIYQGGNWIYTGESQPDVFFQINGKLTHRRSLGAAGLKQTIHGARLLDPNAARIDTPGKHRYLYPLTPEMRAKIEPLAKPYPKRASNKGNHPDQGQGGGAVPT